METATPAMVSPHVVGSAAGLSGYVDRAQCCRLGLGEVRQRILISEVKNPAVASGLAAHRVWYAEGFDLLGDVVAE